MSARMQKAIPILLSLDIPATVNFFTKLGFNCRFQNQGLAILERDEVVLHFTKCPDQRLVEWSCCRIEVADVDALFSETTKQGVVNSNEHGKPHDTDLGTREFGVIDCHGVLITFFERRK